MSKPDDEVSFFDNGIFPPTRIYLAGRLYYDSTAEIGTKTMNDFEKT